MSIEIDFRQVVLVIASAIDLVGVDDVFHGRRVAALATECAKQLGCDGSTQHLLFDAGLLHDIGVSSTRLHHTIVSEFDWEGAERHCERGYQLLKEFAPLSHLAPIIRYHHWHWEDLLQAPVDPATARLANMIYLADRIDCKALPYYADNTILLHVDEICSLFKRHRGTYFSPELIDAFLAAARAEAFWLILNQEYLQDYLTEMTAQSHKQRVQPAEVKQFALTIADIVDAKSHFTKEHSLGVARLARYLAARAGIPEERIDLVEVAALLHDIGKLQVPDEVLESPLKLSAQGRAVMKKHSFATYHILKRVTGFEELARWASEHHECLNGSGYPFHMPACDLPLEARVIKVADIYQALAQNRPYRAPLPPREILSILREMQTELEVDSRIVDLVEAHLDECHQAAVGKTMAPPQTFH